MFIKQLSVFIENRKGRLENVTDVLAEKGINIVSLSLADTSEYGLLRLIVSDPEAAKAALCENGFTATLTNVIAVLLPQRVGALQKQLKVIYEAEINIEYMYPSIDSMIIKASNGEAAIKALEAAGMILCTEEQVYTIKEK